MYTPFVRRVFCSAPTVLYQHLIDHGSNDIREKIGAHTPIQILSGTIIFLMPTLRRNSPRWELCIEFKLAETSDPFHDQTPQRTHYNRRREIFGLEHDSDVLDSITFICSGLHRVSVSHPYLHPIYMQMICKIHSLGCGGAIVTRSFDYIKEPHILSGVAHISITVSVMTLQSSITGGSPTDPACRKMFAR